MKTRDINRREFLKFTGRSAVGFGLTRVLPAGLGLSVLKACLSASKVSWPKALKNEEDQLLLAEGLQYRVLASWEDSVGDASKEVSWGFNNDYVATLPIDAQNAYLMVNFENTSQQFVGKRSKKEAPNKEQFNKELSSVGFGVFLIQKDEKGNWKLQSSSRNTRYTGHTKIPFSKDPDSKKVEGDFAVGTMANCAGGVTPWGSFLSCEENYQDCFGDRIKKSSSDFIDIPAKYKWDQVEKRNPYDYGWVVEVNPKTQNAQKLLSLGRFAHEGACVVKAKDGRPVVYMGDDAKGECLYKFISNKKDSLEEGTLYVAQMPTGKWIPLDLEQSLELKKEFKNQREVLTHARYAAHFLAGTALDRPEDVVCDPKTGALFVALTNNKKAQNYYGSLLRVDEKNADPLSLEFKASTFVSGGPKAGFACPDNLMFDPKGNLWMTTDVFEKSLGKDEYSFFKRNGLFYIPLSGPQKGEIFQVASAPPDAELTGPCMSPDGKRLFINVQHPGSRSRVAENTFTSKWPHKDSYPRPSLVEIRGFEKEAVFS